MTQIHNTTARRWCLALFTMLGLIAFSDGAWAEDEPVKAQQIVYKKTTDAKDKPVELVMHVYKPKGWTKDDQRPVAVFFFGGGWVGGTPQQFFPHCEDLAKLGMLAISAEYRIKGKHGTSPLACVADGKSAIRYVREHAKQLGIDPEKIVSAGGSAGGHVAASTGTLTNLITDGEDSSVSSVPNLMVLFNPVIDTSPETGYGAKKIKGDPLKLSPLHLVQKGAPPTLIFHGDADKVVRIESVRRFDTRCKEIGVACKVVEYEGAGHGFFNHSRFRKPKKDAPDYYKLTMQEMIGFLTKHGCLGAEDE